MSTLPEINQQRVIEKLASSVAEANVKIASLETLAESLRDERDILQKKYGEVAVNIPDPRSSDEVQKDG